MRCRLKIFLFLALVAILFNEAEPLWLSWIPDLHDISSFYPEVILLLRSKFRLKVTKGLRRESKTDFQNGGCGDHLGFSIGSVIATLCLLGVIMFLTKFQFNWIIEEMTKI